MEVRGDAQSMSFLKHISQTCSSTDSEWWGLPSRSKSWQ